MIKILKTKEKDNKKYSCTCHYCSCKFSYQYEDTFHVYGRPQREIKCPNCKKSNWVLKGKTPPAPKFHYVKEKVEM